MRTLSTHKTVLTAKPPTHTQSRWEGELMKREGDEHPSQGHAQHLAPTGTQALPGMWLGVSFWVC